MNPFRLALIAVAVLAFAAPIASLTLLRREAAKTALAEAQTQQNLRELRGRRWPCRFPRDMNEALLQDATGAAAQAVGLQIEDMSIAAGPGPVAGSSRTLTMDLQARGGFDAVLGFLRLGVFAKPALSVDALELTGAGGSAVSLKMRISATCSF